MPASPSDRTFGTKQPPAKGKLTASFLSEVQFLQMESVGTCFCSLLRSGRKVQRVPWRLGLRLLFAPNPKSFLVAQTMCESVVMIDALRNGLLGRCGFHRTPQPADSSSDIRHFFVRGGGGFCRTHRRRWRTRSRGKTAGAPPPLAPAGAG